MTFMDQKAVRLAIEYFDGLRINLNTYWEEPGVASIVNGHVRANSRILKYYAQRHHLGNLAAEIESLDLEELGIIEYLETLRGVVLPEIRASLGTIDDTGARQIDIRPQGHPVQHFSNAIATVVGTVLGSYYYHHATGGIQSRRRSGRDAQGKLRPEGGNMAQAGRGRS